MVGGAELPTLPLALWAGYGLYATSAVNASGIVPASDVSFRAIKLGAGYTIIPFVRVNLEYAFYTPLESKSGGTTTTVSNVYSSTSQNGILISVSAPLSMP